MFDNSAFDTYMKENNIPNDILESKDNTDSISRRTIERWRAGNTSPRKDSLQILCRALNVNPDQFTKIKNYSKILILIWMMKFRLS